MRSNRQQSIRRSGFSNRLGWLLSLLAVLLVFGVTPVFADMGMGGADQRIAPIGRVHIAGQDFVPAADSAASGAEAPELIAAPRTSRKDYPNVGVSSRAVVWILAQLHLFFGALVLAVPLFVLVIELVGVTSGDERYDSMAHEFMKISLTGFSITAIFGGSLALALFLLYPDFMGYMMHVFGAQWLVYAGLFFLESFFLYTYYYGWNAMRYGNLKWVHLSLGLLLNGAGMTIMVISNSWATFMMAPSGVNEVGVVVGNIWEVMKGPLWNPINLHRFIANIGFGGAVVGAYAAYKFLSTKDMEKRAHYDWMGYTSNFIAILAFLPLPFAGYWLMAEIYAYSQQMGITAMGGILAWLFIVQAVLIGTILLAGNYYLWAGMSRTEGSKRYKPFIGFIAFVLVVCFLTWVTPHTLILSASEIAQLGGSHHHILGPLGIMPAKNIAVNLMLIVTFLSFQLYRRSDKVATVSWAPIGNALMVAIYVVAIVNIIFLGVYYGYFTNTVYKVGSSVAQVSSTLVVIIAGIVIDSLMFKNAKTLPSHWGRIPDRAQYALFALPIAFTWLMGLMGYVRSSVKTHWHVYTVMKDNSPDNFIPTIGYAGNMITIVTVLFLLFVLFMFWVASLSGTKQAKPETVTEGGVA
ncbi:MAG: cytochrome ubiquinol oxidase subunit I [gamma proteobacterium endosymbiont of Lamellibrachia anaximandri]|nr:cytochrome ubiquinol oxidase subunit I [gamma proteobacterium endosymbiont of Lamellibrachia anaximandri]MBL3533545.1 cytochrome ubiquinol oxidase subunit I [gamma proteobacterium endosymbiont of Lamellibrachia anaximandri]